jgi:hypothetical protein
MRRTRYLLIQTFLFCLIAIFFMEYTLPTTRSLISILETTSNPVPTVSLWDKVLTYEKSVAFLGNFFCIIGPFLGVFLSYMLSRLVQDVERRDKTKRKEN